MPESDVRLATIEDLRAAYLYCHAAEDALEQGAPLSPQEQREILAIAMRALGELANHCAPAVPYVALDDIPQAAPAWLVKLMEGRS